MSESSLKSSSGPVPDSRVVGTPSDQYCDPVLMWRLRKQFAARTENHTPAHEESLHRQLWRLHLPVIMAQTRTTISLLGHRV
ncbi:hypothetical protein JOB18_012853 [Solea senegalensis]|uniref:Uncharacterized protein n=1 Tax=Solea senegalensis TaxID=28829 RepID=A0AAV6SSR2_SOLSE|nr:hypothetical protein JOB18_012853 [Solea senegalensis]